MTGLRIWNGIAGGIAAGIVMAMVAMMYTLLTQGDLLAPVTQMGAIFFPSDSGSTASLAAGLMLHMMTAAVFGAIFVVLARSAVGDLAIRGAGFLPLAIAGMAYIMVEWLIASFAILPLIDRPLLPTFASIGGLVAHLMYGVVLAGWLAWRVAPLSVTVRGGPGNSPA